MMNGDKPNTNEPYPSVRGALMLTLMAMLAAGFTGIAFIDFGLLAAVGIGQAIGVGAVATMGAKRVPEPQARRLGLRGLDLETIPMILCLIPAILLASELDNFATDFSGGETPISEAASARDSQVDEESAYDFEVAEVYDAVEPSESLSDDQVASNYDSEDSAETDNAPAKLIDPDDPASILQAFIVMVGISPIVEEFLFRGVIQQGIVQRLGLIRGVSVVALFWTLLRLAPISGFSGFLAAAIASFALGWALGMVRIATQSILGPILLASGWAAIGVTAIVLEGRTELPGMNVPGTHLPVLVTLGSAILVGWAGWTIFQEALRQFAKDGAPDDSAPEEDGPI